MNKILSLLLTIFILVGIGGGGYYFITQQSQKELAELEKKSKTTEIFLPAEKTEKITISGRDNVEKKSSFYLTTDKENYTVGETFNLTVMVNAGGKIIDGVEFVLNFDTNLIEIGEPIYGEFFSLYPQKNVDLEKGIIKVIALQPPNENKVLDEEIVVVLPITVLEKGIANFEFNKSKTHIAGYGGQELLEEAKGMEIIIK